MFMHAFEFVGQPDIRVPRLNVAYEWDLCRGAKPWEHITREDVVRCLGDVSGDKCVDIEPDINPVYSGLRTVVRNAEVLNRIAAWGRDTCRDGERFGLYGGAPYIRGLWDAQPDFHAARELGEKVLEGLGLGGGNTAVDVDLYRVLPHSDEAYDFTLDGEVERLPPSARIWMSPVRNAADAGELSPELWRSDLVRVARACLGSGRRVVLWYPRVRPGADGSSVPIPFGDVGSSPWMDVCRSVVRHFTGAELFAY